MTDKGGKKIQRRASTAGDKEAAAEAVKRRFPESKKNKKRCRVYVTAAVDEKFTPREERQLFWGKLVS